MSMSQVTPLEGSTPLLSLAAFDSTHRFGNLIKQGGVNALCWYTVELDDGEQPEVYAFDAQQLVDDFGVMFKLDFEFKSDINESIVQAKELAEKRFSDFAQFAQWVRQNYYPLSDRNSLCTSK